MPTTTTPAVRSRRIFLFLQPAFVALWVASTVSVLTYSLWSCSSLSSSSASSGSGVGHITPSSFVPANLQSSAPKQQPQQQQQPASSHPSLAHADCSASPGSPAAASVPTAEELSSTFEDLWGPASCVVLRNACMDQGNFVTFGDSPYGHSSYGSSSSSSSLPSGSNTAQLSTHSHSRPTNTIVNSSSSSSSSSPTARKQGAPWLHFKPSPTHLDFRGVGDVAGIIQHPPPLIRPGGPDEDAPDMRPPHSFSNCVRPVVLYLNFLYAFGDWWLRSMPTFMHALAAGAWDSRYQVLVATGGQKLERWQKLLLQTLTDQPVSTLSEASSRASSTARHSAAAVGAAAAADTEHRPEQQQQEQQQQQQRNLRQSQQHQEPPTAAAAAAAPVTAYGRCFELLTICSVSDARHFPVSRMPDAEQQGSDNSNSSSSSSSSSSVPRETWAGAQYVRQYYMQRYGQQYHRLPQKYSRLKEPGAFRVVFAVRAPAAAAAPKGGDGTASSGSSSSNVQANPSEQQLAASTRQVLNIQELLEWCNSWQPAAAAGQDLEGIDSSSTAAAAAEGGVVQKRYQHTVCVAHQFGQHGETDSSNSSSSSSSAAGGPGSGGWRGRAVFRLRQLLSATAAAASASDFLDDPAEAAGGSGATTTLQQRLHPPSSTDRQQQQQQQWPWGDPDLDPRALMADLAVMDNADVLVGLHGAHLYNGLFMPAGKALVEVRPFGFWGGWPQTYFQDPLVKVDKDQGTLWYGLDTVNSSNSAPGRWERLGVGMPGTYPRDRHTRIEPAALGLLFRRILWAREEPAAYKELKYAGLTHITDTMQPAQQFHRVREKAEAAAERQAQQQRLQRPEIAAAVEAAREAG